MTWFDLPAPSSQAANPDFADANAARAWLKKQPLAMPARLQTALAEQFERLSATTVPAFTRASLLEALRNATVTAQSAVRRKFAFQPRPLGGDAADAFVASVRVWNALAVGYLQCFQEFAAEVAIDPAGDRQRLAVAAHRALVTSRHALEDHFLAGVEAPEELWQRLQRLSQAITILGVADMQVADPEYRDAPSSSPADQYVHAVLLALSDPYRWTSAYYAVAQRAFTRWRSQAQLALQSNDDPRMRWIPLSAVAPVPTPPGEGTPAWLEVHQIRRKLRKRIKALEAGETPEDLRLGRELGSTACRELLDSILEHLRAAYSEPREALTAIETDCEIAVGPLGCFELLANRPFDGGQTLNVVSARIMHERMAIFGNPDRVEAQREEVRTRGEPWCLIAESVRTAELARPPGEISTRMLPGQLVVFRDARSAASLTVVTRAWTRRGGQTEVTLRRLPGKPEALTARAVDLFNEPPFPVFVLPDVPAVGSTTTLLLPTGIAPRLKKGLDARGNRQFRCLLGKLLDRGADFERYEFIES